MPKLPAAPVIAAIPAYFFTVAIFRVKLILGDLLDGFRGHGLAIRRYSGRIGSRNRRAGPGNPRRGGLCPAIAAGGPRRKHKETLFF